MKRKWTALLCALCLLAQLCAPSRAAGLVYFTAVNDTLLDVSEGTMPFWYGGFLYVDSSVFANRELGLSYSRNYVKGTMVFYTPGEEPAHALVFHLEEGTVTDGQGVPYAPAAIVKGTSVFLPAVIVAQFFNLTYSNTKVYRGYLVRIRSAAAYLSDKQLADAGYLTMEDKYAAYQAQFQTEQETTPTRPESTAGQRIYLALRPEDTAEVPALLDALGTGAATFYLTADQIASNGDLARRLAAQRMVGLAADAAKDTPVPEQLREANTALFAAAGEKTRLCVVENAAPEALAAAAAAGYCPLTPDVDRGAYSLRSAGNANYLVSQVSARGGSVTVWLGSSVGAAGLRSFVSLAQGDGNRLLALTETA